MLLLEMESKLVNRFLKFVATARNDLVTKIAWLCYTVGHAMRELTNGGPLCFGPQGKIGV
jgi:hypothetical protein